MRKLDLTGRKFRHLTVIKEISNGRSGRVTWLCKCDCGNECKVTAQHLTRTKNPVKSCGCKKISVGRRHVQWKGYEEISGDFWTSRIIRSEKKRAKIPYDLTMEQAWKIYIEQDRKCALTGIPLTFPKSCSDRSSNISLDRIDSSKGYTKDNVQWVHKDINRMKNSYKQEYFIELCKLVAENRVCPIK